jgi:hypothetical protein
VETMVDEFRSFLRHALETGVDELPIVELE